MTSGDCDYEGGPPFTRTSGSSDYGVDHIGQWRLMTVITEWPHWTMTPGDYDYVVNHLGP